MGQVGVIKYQFSIILIWIDYVHTFRAVKLCLLLTFYEQLYVISSSTFFKLILKIPQTLSIEFS